jgi:ribonuclease D
MITTKNGILAMLAQLKQRTIIAYDLERSIPGFFGGHDQICLIQFSIMDADFILDTLEPEVQSNLPLLNAVFANPEITKIVHGHDDKKWLANVRIQVHNQVDTSSHGNYARMVHRYCGIQIGKEFQTANWTQRLVVLILKKKYLMKI